MALTLYNKKRNFKATPEPKGKAEKSSRLHFVVQRHDASHLHYDFRLEMEGVLKSWAVPKGPSMKAGERRLAVMVEDHPVSYGTFAGEIPEGNYGAGIVQVWDNGTYQPLEKIAAKDAEKHLLAQLKKGDLKFVLNGKHLKGAYALVRMKTDDGSDRNWLLIKKKDEYALTKYDIETIRPVKPFAKKKSPVKKAAAKKSVTPKKSETVKKEKAEPPKKVKTSSAWMHLQKPMLATLASDIPGDDGWLYEVKYDGYRSVSLIGDGNVEMISRNGNSFNAMYASLVEELKKIEDEVILDGEVVIENKKGISDFQLLQNYSKTKEGELIYYVFDILFLNGHRTDEIALLQRKELLKAFFKKYKFKNIINSEFSEGKGKQLADRLKRKGYEGVLAKKADGLYYPGKRTDSWLKIKNVLMQEAIICGYTEPQRSRKYFGSLVLGMYKDDKLVYIGNCGTGFTDTSLKELHGKLQKLETEKCPFAEIPARRRGQKDKFTWLKPVLVCNVKFQEWTDDEHMRVPVFEGIRTDKKAKDVIHERPVKAKRMTSEKPPLKKNVGKKTAGKPSEKVVPRKGVERKSASSNKIVSGKKELTLTNPDKIYFPREKITKGEVVDYYRRISKYMLPYLKDRPESLNRHPGGIDGMSFYQKDMDTDKIPSWLKTSKIFSKSNEEYIDYLVCNDQETLLYMANLGCIEINPWHSRVSNPDNPDYLMMDLDPAGKITFKDVVDTALVVKDICDELKIPCFCKTSGATGMHIYIPLGAKYTYDEVKLFAELLAIMTHKRLPDITSIERSVAKRKNKIYVDFLQNRKGQTIASAYSVRPRPGATVSTPLKWTEVNHKLDPTKFTIYTTEARVKKVGDLWKGVLGKGINLPAVLKRMKD